jgi:hypothetical protein
MPDQERPITKLALAFTILLTIAPNANLTYRHQGLDMKLTDVDGEIIHQLIA